jgi:hypothetical protein
MKIPIVKDHGASIRTGLDINLDRKALPDGSVYRGERILRACLVMESAMGDRNGNKPGWCRHCEKLPHRLPGLVTGKLLDSSGVPASFKSGLQPDIDNSQSDFDRDHALSEGEDVSVVVLA